MATRVRDDDAVLLAAGVAFFGLLAVFPAMVAAVSIYGLVADPDDVADQVDGLTGALPPATQAFVAEQLDRIVATSSTGLGVGLVLGVVVALWSASGGVRYLVAAVRSAFRLPRRGYVRARVSALVAAALGVVVLVGLVVVLTVAPSLAEQAGDGPRTLVAWLRWPLLAVVMIGALDGVYRVARRGGGSPGPSRFWTPGAVVAAVVWLASSAALALYAARAPGLETTYGTFGAVLVLMLWLLVTAVAVLIGAYVDDDLDTSRHTGPDVAPDPEPPDLPERPSGGATAPEGGAGSRG